MTPERYYIGQISLSKTNISNTLKVIEEAILENKQGYICVTNSRTTYLANHDQNYCQIQNNSMLTVPDGMPLVWTAHNLGFKEVGRVSGPDLMDAIFKISQEKNYSHYFFGSTPQTIDLMKSNLTKKYPELQIRGAVSPPFQPIESFEIDSLANEINQLKPTFFWCGLGAPKQERFIASLQPKLDSTICIGVGLAFEYIACTVKRAPIIIQKTGFEWVYRLAQQPQNIKRAIRPLSWIFTIVVYNYLKKIICPKNHLHSDF